MSLPHRAAGSSGLEVSTLALGSWRTYERVPREQAVAVLDAAHAAGIDFLEIARYNDDPYADHWFEKRLAAR
jgi:aryl-alcohol dehydrogenase-like predicted oxidoreductase